ncbi:MAG: hypothetical protein ACKVZ6_08490, partial [Kineosporiaceae bacterium]
VNALVALPNGTLAVGGEFTTVNGAAQAGLVALDPATGATAASPAFALQYRSGTTTAPGTVTGLSLQGGWLYAGGSFTHVAGGTPLSGYAYAKRGARFNLTTSRPDFAWNPAFGGTPIFVLASAAGDRVYYGGFMATMNDNAVAVPQFATVTTTTPAAPVPGLAPRVSSAPAKATYQQTAVEQGGRFILGGSEHSFHSYDRADMALTRGNISNANPGGGGGDFQASVVDSGVAYASCHCSLSFNFGGRTQWSTVDAYDDIDNIRYIGAYDLQTGRYLYDYTPWIRTRAVRGSWALTVDSNGCLWEGGDTTQTKRRTDSAWQTSGGFSRFCRADSTPPGVPTALKQVKAADGSVTVSWTGSIDNRAGTLRYTVFQGDVPIATTTSWKVVRPAADAAGTYVVRALDKAGNVGATSAPIVVAP